MLVATTGHTEACETYHVVFYFHPLLSKDRIQSLPAVNSFANNFGDTFSSCIGIIKLIEVKSVERLLVLCTPFLRSYTEVTESGLLPYFMQHMAKITFYRKASG